MDFIVKNWDIIVTIYFAIVGVASAVVKLAPVLPENHPALTFLKILAKFVALNRKEVTPEERLAAIDKK